MPSLRDRIIARVEGLVETKFQGNYAAAVAYYDEDKDEMASKAEVSQLLKDAGVGNMFTRSTVVDEIFREVDADSDGFISPSELRHLVATPDLRRASVWGS